MLAKLRCASGVSSKSRSPIVVFTTLLEFSIGAAVNDSRLVSTLTVCRTAAGCSFAFKVEVEATATVTDPVLVAKPAASTLTSYVPGGSDSMANSPSLLVFTVRTREKFLAEAVIVAPAMRAPVTSTTVPTSEPSGLCAPVRMLQAKIRPAMLAKTFTIIDSLSRERERTPFNFLLSVLADVGFTRGPEHDPE